MILESIDEFGIKNFREFLLMDWSYFIVDDKFKPKRLPAVRSPVKIKDITNFTDFREELRYSRVESVEGAIEEYQSFFDYGGGYEVEVDCFSDVFEKNPFGILGELSELSGHYDLIFEELYSWEPADGLVRVPNNIGKLLSENGFVEVSPVGEGEWMEYLSERTIPEIKQTLKEYRLPLGGKKDELLNKLYGLIVEGKLKEDEPFFVTPTPAFKAWVKGVAERYVEGLKGLLPESKYPRGYLTTVIEEGCCDLDGVIGRKAWEGHTATASELEDDLDAAMSKQSSGKSRTDARGVSSSSDQNNNVAAKLLGAGLVLVLILLVYMLL